MATDRGLREHREGGFTLVELAVVLAVIGVLLVMVLKSSSITDTAKTNDLIAIAGDLSNAVRQYRAKYNYLPGDDPQAVQDVGAATGHFGNGNGSIDFSAVSGAEWDMAPDHLFKAGLIRTSADPSNSLGLASLTSPYGKVWLVSYGVAITPAGGGSNQTPCGVAVSSAGGTPIAVNMILFANIPAAVAQQIDAKLDDGNPTTGSIRASVSTTTYNTATGAAPIACFALPL
jgi:prepilin-type N-terminal cleavage/methylation domain-containing protein